MEPTDSDPNGCRYCYPDEECPWKDGLFELLEDERVVWLFNRAEAAQVFANDSRMRWAVFSLQSGQTIEVDPGLKVHRVL